MNSIAHDPIREQERATQLWFMSLIGLMAPAVMTGLREETYPLFAEYTRLYTQELRTPPEGMYIEFASPIDPLIVSLTWSSLTCDKEGTALQQSILDWSKRRNLDADWCRDHALNVMLAWLETKATPGSVDDDLIDVKAAILGLHSVGPAPYENPIPTIDPPPGMPPYHIPESRKSYLDVIEYMVLAEIEASPLLTNAESSYQKAFVRSILDKATDYRNRVLKHYEAEDGLKVVSGKSQNLRDLMWTIQFQVFEMEYTQIAAGEHEVSTVARAVQRTLKKIRLTERPNSGPGRPAGRKDSPHANRQRQKRHPRRRAKE